MARFYDVAAAAVALQIPSKWLDNLLSHHAISGVSGGRQGVTRRITGDGLVRIALIAELSRGQRIPIPAAVRVIDRALESPEREIELAPGLRLVVQAEMVERRLAERLIDSVEFAAPRRRGRPPRRRLDR